MNWSKSFWPTRLKEKLIWVIILLGIVFRIRQYVFNRALWSDEALLANNFLQYPIRVLLTQPLANGQGAPLGFILFTKLNIRLFGNYDYILRIVPVISGILVIICTFFLSRILFNTFLGRVVFTGLMAFCPILIYYSSEFKQYSSDVFISVLLLTIALAHQKIKYWEWLFAGVGTLSIWLSHPSLFILASIGIVLFVDSLRRKEVTSAVRLCLIALAWTVSFLFVYFLSLRSLSHNSYLINYWRLGYAPFPIRSLGDLHWYLESFLGVIYLTFQQIMPASPAATSAWFAFPNWILFIIFIAGGVYTFLASRKLFIISILIIVLNIVASSLQIYPFRNRLILYLVPIVFLFGSMLVQGLFSQKRRWLKTFSCGISLLLIGVPLLSATQVFIAPLNFSNIKEALNSLEDEIRPHDYITLNVWAVAPYIYYQRSYDFKKSQFINQIPKNNSSSDYLKSLCETKTLGRTWIVFTHDDIGKASLLGELEKVRPLLASWESDRAGVYLFDFSKLELCY